MDIQYWGDRGPSHLHLGGGTVCEVGGKVGESGSILDTSVVKLKWEGKGELLMGKRIHVERKQIMNGK